MRSSTNFSNISIIFTISVLVISNIVIAALLINQNNQDGNKSNSVVENEKQRIETAKEISCQTNRFSSKYNPQIEFDYDDCLLEIKENELIVPGSNMPSYEIDILDKKNSEIIGQINIMFLMPAGSGSCCNYYNHQDFKKINTTISQALGKSLEKDWQNNDKWVYNNNLYLPSDPLFIENNNNTNNQYGDSATFAIIGSPNMMTLQSNVKDDLNIFEDSFNGYLPLIISMNHERNLSMELESILDEIYIQLNEVTNR